ncbi:MAG: hypothetical protein FJ150_04510 [Euryarchaeota archaeon]|nr:hypothetical protein [Euryarchaeota archaeon]
MKETVEIKPEDIRSEKPKKKKKKRSMLGIYFGLCLIVVGVIWYGVNIGIIPLTILKEQAGPILVVLIGILIFIKAL